MPSPPFGRIASAVVTPMTAAGSLDLAALQGLVEALVEAGHDGIVVNGTTGEAPTTSDAEKIDVIRAVVEAVGDRAAVTAGVGTNDTAHTIELSRQAAAAGAQALLVVTPYYSRPSQAGIVAHTEAVADAGELPVMLYDIPARSGIALEADTLRRLADHPRVLAVKDAKADYWQASALMRDTGLQWYSGDDAANLMHLANGAVGIVGVTSQVAPRGYARMVDAMGRGDLEAARQVHRDLIPLVDAVMGQTQGAVAAKAALHHLGRLPSDYVRLPLVAVTDHQRAVIRDALTATGDL